MSCYGLSETGPSCTIITLRSYRRSLRVKSKAAFGSFARGSQNADSDIDILVEFERPVGVQFIDLADHSESILDRKVDLVSRKDVKTKYFERIKNELQYV